ncbi:MAG: NADH-quinone oxidoreductase subunit N [Gammaproteobacteria bacterium]|nr:NADH-quinone oxidoreductase subunit N [Gammaproteobacteria bacterium]
MTGPALTALAPYIVLTGGVTLMLLAISFVRRGPVTLALTLAVLLATLASVGFAAGAGAQLVDDFVLVDGYAHFFTALFVLAAAATAVLTFGYVDRRAAQREEFYILLLTATLGAMTMGAAAHFGAFLLGMEILSISLYAMIAYPDSGRPPLEAAIKYLVLSGVASTTILFGMALVYGETGSMQFADALAGDGALLRVGQGMILAGLAFKLSLVPFHMWTPDVYQGAPAPVTGFVATVSKGAVAALLIRYAVTTEVLAQEALFFGLSLIAIVSMVAGNVLALLQDNLKRLLAYSSIAHMGYLLIAVLAVASAAGPQMAAETGMVYIVGYFAMTLAAFGVMTALSTDEDVEDLAGYEGLFWRRPLLAAVLAAAALSLAGIPLTVGFIAKFYLFAAGVEGSLWLLVWALVIGSAIGVYYYLRIVFGMTRQMEAGDEASPSWWAPATVAVLGVAIVVMGVYPTPLIDAAREAIRGFGG